MMYCFQKDIFIREENNKKMIPIALSDRMNELACPNEEIFKFGPDLIRKQNRISVLHLTIHQLILF